MSNFMFVYSDGLISKHDTLEGMVEMLLEELYEEEDYKRESKSYYQDEWCENQMIDFIIMFDIEVISGELK